MTVDARMDWTEVENKDPNLHYVWARADDPLEMQYFSSMKYVPALGKEKPTAIPWGETPPKEGEPKRIGNRILMCIPLDLAKQRRNIRARRASSNPQQDEEATAKELNRLARRAGHRGDLVRPLRDDE